MHFQPMPAALQKIPLYHCLSWAILSQLPIKCHQYASIKSFLYLGKASKELIFCSKICQTLTRDGSFSNMLVAQVVKNHLPVGHVIRNHISEVRPSAWSYLSLIINSGWEEKNKSTILRVKLCNKVVIQYTYFKGMLNVLYFIPL